MASNHPISRDVAFGQLKSFLESANSLKIVVSGKTGVGKSSLINSICGCQVAKESDKASPETKDIVSFSKSFDMPYLDIKDTTTLTMWDTPGFGDILVDTDCEQKRIEELIYAVDMADVLLCCFDIRTPRITNDDMSGPVELTRAMGGEVWRKAVFVLTFSNEAKISRSSNSTDLVSYFKDVIEDKRQFIHKMLKTKAGVPDEIVEDIPVVPVGYSNSPPPDRENWYTPFWIEVFKKTRQTGKAALLRITWPRLDCKEDIRPDSHINQSKDNQLPSVDIIGKDLVGLVQGEMKQKLRSTQIPTDTASTPQEPAYEVVDRVHPQNDYTGPPPVPNTQRPPLPPTLPVPQPNQQSQVPGPVPVVEDVPNPENRTKKMLTKAAKAGTSIGSTAVTGALVGLIIGIAGGPIGMGVGAAAGLAIGAGTGVGGIIAMAVKEYSDERRAG